MRVPFALCLTTFCLACSAANSRMDGGSGDSGVLDGGADAGEDAGMSAGDGGTDAGRLALIPDGGCWAVPGDGDCATRCDAASPAYGSVEQFPDAGVCQGPIFACACGAAGSVDYAAGCTQDSDCTIVSADCCGCGWGAGSSTAVVATNESAFEKTRSLDCRNHGCPYSNSQGCDAGVVCLAGRCAVLMGL